MKEKCSVRYEGGEELIGLCVNTCIYELGADEAGKPRRNVSTGHDVRVALGDR